MGDYYRLRHICLVTDDLEKSKRDICAVFGVNVAFEDPHVIKFEVVNAMFPFGRGFIEVMAPTAPSAASARFLKSSGGQGAYLLAFNCSDARRRGDRAQAMGVRTIYDGQYDGAFICRQLHPRDCRAAMIEFDQTPGEEDINGPLYAAGGMVWQQAVKTDVTRRFTEVLVETPDPAGLGAHWSNILETPFVGDASGGVMRFDMCDIRIAPAPQGSREMISAIRLDVADADGVMQRARDLGYPVEDGRVKMCGVWFLVA